MATKSRMSTENCYEESTKVLLLRGINIDFIRVSTYLLDVNVTDGQGVSEIQVKEPARKALHKKGSQQISHKQDTGAVIKSLAGIIQKTETTDNEDNCFLLVDLILIFQ